MSINFFKISMEKYYRSSGNFSPLAFVLFILSGAIVLPIAAIMYAYAIWYMPIIYLSFFITLLFGLAVGSAMGQFVIKWGKVRNTKLGIIFGILAALIALYLHWAVWISLVQNSGMGYNFIGFRVTASNADLLQTLSLALHPQELLSAIKEVNLDGTWSLKGEDVKGTFLSVIWGIEALIILIASAYAAHKASKKPFSETDEKWFKEKMITVNWIEDKTGFISNLEKAEYEVLQTLQKHSGKEENHTQLTIYHTDNGYFYLSAVNKLAGMDENKKVSFSLDPFVEYILIDQKSGQRLLSLYNL